MKYYTLQQCSRVSSPSRNRNNSHFSVSLLVVEELGAVFQNKANTRIPHFFKQNIVLRPGLAYRWNFTDIRYADNDLS